MLAEGVNAAEGPYERVLETLCRNLMRIFDTGEHVAATHDGWTPFLIAARCCNDIFLECYMKAWISKFNRRNDVVDGIPWEATLPVRCSP